MGVKICIALVWVLLSYSLVDAADVSEEHIASVFRLEFYLLGSYESSIATCRSKINPDTSECEYRIFGWVFITENLLRYHSEGLCYDRSRLFSIFVPCSIVILLKLFIHQLIHK
jgi:hypothetical protein